MTTEALERVLRRLDPAARLVRAWPLPGGASARVTALEAELPGGETRTFVLRGNADAVREFRVLEVLAREGLPVPAPRLLDESRAILPEPYLVIDHVDEQGPPSGPDAARELAALLVQIHAVDAAQASFLPELEAPVAARNEPTLLHGDFWPGNVLWREGRVAAIVDWEDAAIGDPLADVGNCRLELLWAFGPAATHAFTGHYRRARPELDFSDLPHWDVHATRRLAPHLDEWGLGAAKVRELRALAAVFAARAQERLSNR